jgi:hypothetical protein
MGHPWRRSKGMEMKMTTQAQPFGFDRTDGAAHLGLSVSSFDRLVAVALVRANVPELATPEKAAA